MMNKQRNPAEVFWPKVVLKKWLNISSTDSEFSADEGDDNSELDGEEDCGWDGGEGGPRIGDMDTIDEHLETAPYKLRRRNSETLRAQYINTKEVRIFIGTWNAGGKVPPDDLDLTEWLSSEEPADIYVLGFQEIVPLNAGNVFGAEDSRPVRAWENLIRGTLNRIQPAKPRYKCYSDPPSPSRFDPSEESLAAVDDLLPGTDTDSDEDGIPFSFPSSSGDSNGDIAPREEPMPRTLNSTPKKLNRLNHFILRVEDDEDELVTSAAQQKTLPRTLSRSQRIGLVWPEQPLDLLDQRPLSTASSFRSSRSFRRSKSEHRDDLVMIPDVDLDIVGPKRRRSSFVRIVSKQMVGIFLSIWVRKSLRKCIQNLKVSTVGVGAMGYIGNKGSVSVSVSIYQTLFCFVCSHLSAGERTGDAHKRNADVQEIHRRTHFAAAGDVGLPRYIYDHERIFWFGDLNYRIDLPYERTHGLISTKDWLRLAEEDQLKRELEEGRSFDGWSEGVLSFPPTYKYDVNSDKYIGDDLKGGRRTPAWCDRILSFGRGTRLLNYRRAELKLSDHRPVAATFTAEVEEFCSRKLQKALTLTDAEVEGGEVVPDLELGLRMSHVSAQK